MVKIVKSTVLNAPVEEVWEVLRDFNGHDQWHPAVADSKVDRGEPSDKVGCVRRFHLTDGSELREQLLTLSDADMAFSYCLLETPVPLLNYVEVVATVAGELEGFRRVIEPTPWLDTPQGREDELKTMVSENIYQSGFDAVRAHMGLEGS